MRTKFLHSNEIETAWKYPTLSHAKEKSCRKDTTEILGEALEHRHKTEEKHASRN